MEEEFGDYYANVSFEKKEKQPEKELKKEEEESTVDPIDKEEESETKIHLEKIKSTPKKSVKRWALPIRKKRKTKRYKGQCPRF